MTITKRYQLSLLISIALTAATFAVYAQVINHAFVDFDDEEYIVANPHVRTGLSKANIIWAFTSSHSNNWHPLTWISHMTDAELFGLNPAGHHLVNVLLHIINSLLLFLLLTRMTGALWRSAFVAALFALHPLHVESVAWAAERKDVLSAFFWLLTLWMYLHYVRKQTWQRYALILICFACGLMAKQMLVTLPFVLLLLDYWPLRRFSPEPLKPIKEDPPRHASKRGKPLRVRVPDQVRNDREAANPLALHKRLIIEKIPLFILAALASITVFMVQLKSGVLYNLNPFPLPVRIENALVSYIAYIGKMIWPNHLAVFYPHPLNSLPWWQTLGALGLLVLITVVCLKYYRKPYLSVGWFWFLGTLVPVIGLVQVGVQAMADRYTYIPLIGLFIMAAWGIPDLLKNRPYKKQTITVIAAVILIACIYLAWLQVGTWKDRETLYAHAIKMIPNNYWACNNFGAAIASRGHIDEAMPYFSKSLEIMPLYPGANKNMAVALFKKGRYHEALPYLQKALQVQPGNPEYRVIMGLTLMNLGNAKDAIAQFEEALRIHPGDPDAREALQDALIKSRGNKTPATK